MKLYHPAPLGELSPGTRHALKVHSRTRPERSQTGAAGREYRPGAPVSRVHRKEPTMAGTEDRVEGKAKELEGKVTGDEARETEGKGQGMLGKAKDKASDAADSIRGKDDK